jgi:hypothetical protein
VLRQEPELLGRRIERGVECVGASRVQLKAAIPCDERGRDQTPALVALHLPRPETQRGCLRLLRLSSRPTFIARMTVARAAHVYLWMETHNSSKTNILIHCLSLALNLDVADVCKIHVRSSLIAQLPSSLTRWGLAPCAL